MDPETVDRIAASIESIGLRAPITVLDVDGGVTIQLVAGHHRLAAAKKLGWDEIPCFIIEGDNLTAEMWEISENLHRADLSKEQRDEYIRRYAELLKRQEEREIQVRQNDAPEIGYKKPPPQKKGIASQIADETGISTRTVQRVLNPPRKPVSPPDEPHNPFEAYNKWAGEMNRFGVAHRTWDIDALH